MTISRRGFVAVVPAGAAKLDMQQRAVQPVRIGTRREIFVDDELVDSMRGARFELCSPVDAGIALRLDRPWEGRFSAYSTVIHDGGIYRMYYRGVPESGKDGNAAEVTCCAESDDGINLRRPELSFFEVRGAKTNNVILAGSAPYSHNFSPFLDARPGVSEAERYKAMAGVHETGLPGGNCARKPSFPHRRNMRLTRRTRRSGRSQSSSMFFISGRGRRSTG